MDLLFSGEDPLKHGYTIEEEDNAIDDFNRIAIRRGWDIRCGHNPRSRMPNPPSEYLNVKES